MKQERKASGLGRREFLRTLGVGTAAAAASDAARRSGRRRHREQRREAQGALPAESAQVQTFYRVNRYPTK